MTLMRSHHNTTTTMLDDPFDEFLQPPPNETPEERAQRIASEEEAKRVSMAIDEAIKAERQVRKKKRVIRLLLLGQSESGKSTTLRQFQRLYTPTAFREERSLWRAVIQLNVLRSIRVIMDNIIESQREVAAGNLTFVNSSTASIRGPIAGPSTSTTAFASTINDEYYYEEDSDPSLSEELQALIIRLSPLKHAEALLVAKLVPPHEEEMTAFGSGYATDYGVIRRGSNIRSPPEIFVRPGSGWKSVLAKSSSSSSSNSNVIRPASTGTTGLESTDEPQGLLHSCRKDIITLWNDLTVRDILKRRKVRLEESSGFFLNDLDRVTSLRYIPTDEDVLKARLKTVGVCEYKFEMEVPMGRESGTEWRIIDVGGSRSQRQTWVPFFDTVDAIIFLAPISCFDQVLGEDPSVNRLEDSVLLWKAVCLNKLLANVDLVLFLNKCDIMERKLEAGIRLSKYIRSYGDRPNDFENASKYLRSKFSAIHREYSPVPRKFYAFCTSITDSTTAGGILISVRDMVVRQSLKQSKLL